MPNVVFVAPYFSENARRFLEATAGLEDVRLAVISQEPLEALPAAIAGRLAGHWRVNDALDTEQLVGAVSGLAGRLGALDTLLGAVEQIQVQLGEVRERLGIRGMRAETALNFRDKARMKTVLREAGVPCARHRLAASEGEARAFAGEVGYPLIVKPPAGAASQATYRVDADAELDAALAASAPSAEQPVLLEEFLTGSEHSFDAFRLGGGTVFHSITNYWPTPIEAMRTPWVQWTVVLPREIDDPRYDDIRNVAERALDALGLERGMCHMEWFRRTDGSVAVSEVAARPPGAQITTLISRAHDFDSVQAWARLMIFGQWHAPTERRYAAGAAFLRGQGQGRVKAVHGIDVVQREVGELVTDARLPVVGQEKSQSYEGEGWIIVRHRETGVVEEALRRIISTVRVELG